MSTQNGSVLVNSSIAAGGSEVTSSEILLDGRISVGIDADIINGATPPASVPFLLVIEYRRHASGAYFGFNFQGSLTANGIIPIRNLKIPYDAHGWRYRYTAAPDADVTLKLEQGYFIP